MSPTSQGIQQAFKEPADDEGGSDQGKSSPRALGVLCVVCAALLFSAHGTAVRVSSEAGFTTLQLSFLVGLVRLSAAFVLVMSRERWRRAMFCAPHSRDRAFLALVAFRQVIGCAAMAFIFSAFARMPIGEATSLVFTAPIWTAGLSYFWLREPVTRLNVAAACFAFVGVALIANGAHENSVTPDGDMSDRAVGTACALAGAVTLALVMVATRRIGDRLPAAVSIGWYGFSMSFFSLLLAPALRAPIVPTGVPRQIWIVMGAGAMVSFVAQLLMTMALQRLEAAPVNVLATLEIVFSFTWQWLILGTPASAQSICGAGVIIMCAVAVGAQKLFQARAQDLERQTSAAEGETEAGGVPMPKGVLRKHVPVPAREPQPDAEGAVHATGEIVSVSSVSEMNSDDV